LYSDVKSQALEAKYFLLALALVTLGAVVWAAAGRPLDDRSAMRKTGKTRPREKPVSGHGLRPGPPKVIGREGIWTVQLQLGRRVRVRVRIVGSRRMFGRVDLEIETNTGDRAWISDVAVKVL